MVATALHISSRSSRSRVSILDLSLCFATARIWSITATAEPPWHVTGMVTGGCGLAAVERGTTTIVRLRVRAKINSQNWACRRPPGKARKRRNIRDISSFCEVIFCAGPKPVQSIMSEHNTGPGLLDFRALRRIQTDPPNIATLDGLLGHSLILSSNACHSSISRASP